MKNDHVANVLLVCIICIPFAIIINVMNWKDEYGTIKSKISITTSWIIFIVILILGVK